MIKFADLTRQYKEYQSEINAAIQGVLESSQFINGSEVKELEKELAAFSGAKHAIACSSGTDALLIPQMALDIKPGDEIIVPAFTYFASASMISLWGATPVFVDVDPITFNLDPHKIEAKINKKTKAVFGVSLYGQIADFDKINTIAEKHGLWVLEDGAQSFGARYGDRRSCNLTKVATTSFFPAKPLGCYGDGGAMFTDDDKLAIKLKQLVNHGQVKRYQHKYIGLNGRLDTIQAAVLRVKLRYFDAEIKMRQQAADYYTKAFSGVNGIVTPKVMDDRDSTWAQYTIRIQGRDQARQKLQEMGVPTSVHYPMPVNRQEAFAYLGDNTHYDNAEMLSNEVLSLPMHGFISREDQVKVIEAVKKVANG